MRPLHGAVVGAFPLALAAGGCGGVNGSALGLIRRARGSRSNSGSSPGGGGYG